MARPSSPSALESGDYAGFESENLDFDGSLLSSASCGHSDSGDYCEESVICFTCFVEHTSRAKSARPQRTLSSLTTDSSYSGVVPILTVTLDGARPPRPRKRVCFKDMVEIYETYSKEEGFPGRTMHAPDIDAPKRL
jgi:hypothetical protein